MASPQGIVVSFKWGVTRASFCALPCLIWEQRWPSGEALGLRRKRTGVRFPASPLEFSEIGYLLLPSRDMAKRSFLLCPSCVVQVYVRIFHCCYVIMFVHVRPLEVDITLILMGCLLTPRPQVSMWGASNYQGEIHRSHDMTYNSQYLHRLSIFSINCTENGECVMTAWNQSLCKSAQRHLLWPISFC